MGKAASSVHRIAVFAVLAAFLLIVAGGLVTSRDAGLAVPDWPLAYGELNPSRWWQIENVRTEHGHRIVAFCVACLTALLAWRVWRLETRPSVRRLGVAAAALVLVQAGLGGLRVLALSVDLAMVHGWLGQIFFAVLVALATVTSPGWADRARAPQGGGGSERVRWAALALVGAVVAQLVAGIFLRHLGAGARPLLENGVFYLHVLMAVLLGVLAIDCYSAVRGGRAAPVLERAARALCALFILQIFFGVGAWLVTESMEYDRQATLLEAWIPTLHVATGAAILGTGIVLCLNAWANRRIAALASPAGAAVAENP